MIDRPRNATADYALEQLRTALRFKRAAPLLGVSAFFVPAGYVGRALVALAVVFTPYMLWQLWRARWIRAIVVFAAIVLGPALWAGLAQPASNVGVLLAFTVPLLLFYLYVWGLYMAITSRLAAWEHERTCGLGSEADVA